MAGAHDMTSYRRTDRTRSLRRNRARRRRRFLDVMGWVADAGLCAALAFFLLPTGQVSTLALVQINGATVSLPAGSRVSEFAAFSAALARPGSTLDLTGDVTALGAGSDPYRQMDGAPLADDARLADGDLLLVSQGGHVAEGIKRVTQSIPSRLEVAGKGPIVSLVRQGKPGEREIFKGASSSKQAALFVTREAENSLLQRTTSAQPGQKLAALTFDDGPGTHTQEVLDALAAKHVPATFFVLGSSATGNKGMIAKMRAAGHEVENHSWSHPDLTTLTAGEIRSQVTRTNDAIGGSRYLRPPYGSSNAGVKQVAASMGMRLAFWTVDTLDWQHQDVEWILSKVQAGTKPGAIILMHDGGANRLQTVAAIPKVVDWLFAHGYSITTVEHILG